MKKIVSVALLLMVMVVSHGQTDLKKGLVVYLPFNGNANDESGKANNPISNNATLTEDRFGNTNSAYYFNGTSSFMRIKNNSSLCPEEMTLVAVIKPMGFYQGPCYNNTIIDKGVGDYKPGDYALRFTAGEYTQGDCNDGDSAHQNFVGMASTNGGATSQDTYVQLDTWYYLIYTVSKENSRLYVDGEIMMGKQSKIKIGKNSDDVFLGHKDNPKFPYWFKGVIDEIRIYNRALNFEEVTALYEELSQK